MVCRYDNTEVQIGEQMFASVRKSRGRRSSVFSIAIDTASPLQQSYVSPSAVASHVLERHCTSGARIELDRFVGSQVGRPSRALERHCTSGARVELDRFVGSQVGRPSRALERHCTGGARVELDRCSSRMFERGEQRCSKTRVDVASLLGPEV